MLNGRFSRKFCEHLLVQLAQGDTAAHQGAAKAASACAVYMLFLALLVTSCKNEATKQSRIQQLESVLSSGAPDAIPDAATEYRELRGEDPNALRLVASAYTRLQDKKAEFDVLRTIIMRGQGTRDDKLRAIKLALQIGSVSDIVYTTGRRWLDDALDEQPSCGTFGLLVEWTEGRAENGPAIDRALAGCPRDYERAHWLWLRAARTGSVDDACDSVAHGIGGRGYERKAARQCATDSTGWKSRLAKAVLENTVPADLLTETNLTAAVLLAIAASSTTTREEACRALVRAREIESSWLPVAGNAIELQERYRQLQKQRACG